MAIRLDKAFGGGAETWLRLQMAYDLAQARSTKARLRSSGCAAEVGRAAPLK